jgi:hypothetical protein
MRMPTTAALLVALPVSMTTTLTWVGVGLRRLNRHCRNLRALPPGQQFVPLPDAAVHPLEAFNARKYIPSLFRRQSVLAFRSVSNFHTPVR